MPLFGRANWKKNGLTSLGYNGPVNTPRRTTMRQYFPRAPIFSRLPGTPPTRRNNAVARAVTRNNVVLRNHMANFNRMEELNRSTNSYVSPRGARSGNGSSSGGPTFSTSNGSSSGGPAFSSSNGSSSGGPNGRQRRGSNGTRRARNRSQSGNSNLAGLGILEEFPGHPASPSILMNVGSSGGKTWASGTSGSGSNISMM